MKRCPFCGTPGIIESKDVALNNGSLDTLFRVVCYSAKCGVSTRWWYPESAAVETWNRRPRKVRK